MMHFLCSEVHSLHVWFGELHTANKGLHSLIELQRFRSLPTNIKLHLVKAFILPVLTYAPIPTITASSTGKKKLQSVLNKSLRFSFNERYPYNHNTRTLHNLAKIEPINHILYTNALSAFNKVRDSGDEAFANILAEYEVGRNHGWFKKTRNITDRGAPARIYTV